VRLRRAVDEIDVTELLPRVRAPTLVFHCRNDAMQPFEEGRRLAAGIPGARFVALEGRNHLVLESDPAWTRLLHELKIFL
jgi:pimeloyl-ACP methyl ester carboxylesterase